MLAKDEWNTSVNSDDGFTLLEIVIAIGLLFIISSVGVMAIRNFDDRTKEVAVQRAAREVYNAARAKVEDGNPNTTAKDAAAEYNNSQSSKTANNNRPITVKVIEKSTSNPNDLRVEAYYDGGRIMSSYETPTAEGGSGGPGGSGNGGVIIPIVEDTISQFTYQCDSTMSGYLPVYNISDSTTVSVFGSDGSEKLLDYSAPDTRKIKSSWGSRVFSDKNGFNNVSENLTMKAGVTYTVKVYGKFDNLSPVNTWEPGTTTGDNMSFNHCLISVDKLGQHSGLTTMNWFAGAKLVSMPEELPSTVTDLSFAFRATPIFNDPNISNWDTSNVTTLYYTFSNAYKFNQPLNWDTSNVASTAAAFVNAREFNQPLLWDTSRVVYFGSMFSGATVFNQNLSERTVKGVVYWDTGKVQSMNNVFTNARAFNNGQSAGSAATSFLWDTSSATNMNNMFQNANAFNSSIARTTGSAHWDTRKVRSMKFMFSYANSYNRPMSNWFMDSVTTTEGMFKNAKSFNQTIEAKASHGYWNMSKVESMTEMFFGADKFNRDISNWEVGSVTDRTDFNTGSVMASNPAYQPKW